MASEYKFVRGFPTPEGAQLAYEEGDLGRAVQAYRLACPRAHRTPPRSATRRASSSGGRCGSSSTPSPARSRCTCCTGSWRRRALLRSLIDLKHSQDAESIDLFFGPAEPDEADGRWVKTLPGRGWFAHFRIYGPDAPAFDGTWRLPDFQQFR
jgi:hypothetical protein